MVALVSASLFVLSLFFSVLAPILPQLGRELNLTAFETGVLVAMLGAGAITGTLGGALLAVRIGVQPTALIALVTLAAASLAFGLAHSYAVLLASRFLQGCGDFGCGTALLSWLFDEVPVPRRGEMLGVVLGASGSGAVFGPVIGGLAAGVGRLEVFSGLAAAILLAAPATLLVHAPEPSGDRRLQIGAAFRQASIRRAMWLNILPPMLIAALTVLVPLQLDHLGAGAGAITLCFAAGAMLGALTRPAVGRWSDRRGRIRPVKACLLPNIPLLVVLPLLTHVAAVIPVAVITLIVSGLLWTPLLALVVDACAAVGVTQIAAVAIMNLVGAPGGIIGSVASGLLVQIGGQQAAYALLVAVLLGTWVALKRVPESAFGVPTR